MRGVTLGGYASHADPPDPPLSPILPLPLPLAVPRLGHALLHAVRHVLGWRGAGASALAGRGRVMAACRCSESKRPTFGSMRPGSNERPRQWFVLIRNERHYASSRGSHWSDYSLVQCRVCGCQWRTKAKYQLELQDCEYWPQRLAPQAPPLETAGG